MRRSSVNKVHLSNGGAVADRGRGDLSKIVAAEMKTGKKRIDVLPAGGGMVPSPTTTAIKAFTASSCRVAVSNGLSGRSQIHMTSTAASQTGAAASHRPSSSSVTIMRS